MRNTFIIAGFFCIAVSAAWAFIAAPRVEGRQKENADNQDCAPPLGPAAEKFRYLGNGSCAQCHTNGPVPPFKGDFVTQRESGVWNQDKHSRAFELIRPRENELSGKMCEILGIPEEAFYVEKQDTDEQKQLAGKAQVCLSCHANWLKDRPRPPYFAQGVNCEACHGPSSGWRNPHADPPPVGDWRSKTPREKEAVGMIDVRDPARRAAQCYSCHIGNAAEGKVVTHEMYAAGHPPLPSVELETFIQNMPPHWKPFAKKGEFEKRAEYLKANPDLVSESLPRARSVILSGLLSLRHAACLAAQKAKDDKAAWPELSLFDCYACHHDLQAGPNWRQKRGYPGKPGRPSLLLWPTTLVEIGLSQTSEDPDEQQKLRQGFKTHWEAVQKELDERPFGSRQGLETACRALVGFLDKAVEAVKKSNIDAPAARRALRQLVRQGQERTHDFHSARLIAWASWQLYQETKPPPSNAAAIEKLFNEQLHELVDLQLPAQDVRILDKLGGVLDRLGRYEPADFQAAMKELDRLLGE